MFLLEKFYEKNFPEKLTFLVISLYECLIWQKYILLYSVSVTRKNEKNCLSKTRKTEKSAGLINSVKFRVREMKFVLDNLNSKLMWTESDENLFRTRRNERWWWALQWPTMKRIWIKEKFIVAIFRTINQLINQISFIELFN